MPRGLKALCPRESEHTPHLTGYLAHAEWAEKMLLTHHQVKCPGCDRWAIWVVGAANHDDTGDTP